MATSVQSLFFYGRRYPFFFAAFVLFLAVSFLLFFSSSEFSFFTSPSLALLRQSANRSPPSPTFDIVPPDLRRDSPLLTPRNGSPSFNLSPPVMDTESMVENRLPPPDVDSNEVVDTLPLSPLVTESPNFSQSPPVMDSDNAFKTPPQLPPPSVVVKIPPPLNSPEDEVPLETLASLPPEIIESKEVFETESPVISPDSDSRKYASAPELVEEEGTSFRVRQGVIEFDEEMSRLEWFVCKGGATAVDYIPCLDNWKAIKALKSRRHMEHRERHCPEPPPRCLVPLPKGYKIPIRWPKSRDMIWYDNVPHSKLVEYKKDQRWVVKSGDYFVFPGGGTQFKEGVAHYIEFIEKEVPVVQWGQNIHVVLDVGCGVASFGGHLLDRDVLTMSLAPKDEHEAQIQFALERGIPATLSVIGTQQLTFPDNAFDLVHCARCRVHWDGDGGKPLLELNRVLRPGGFFIWSATPVYRTEEKEVRVWNSMVALTKSMCWKVVRKTMGPTGIGLVVYQKPDSPSCYKEREVNDPPMCDAVGRNMSWYSPL